MKLLETSDTRTIIFNGVPFLELVSNTLNNERDPSGKYTVYLEPWIEFEMPKLIKSDADQNKYEIVIYNITSEKYGETNKDNQILRTRTSYIYSRQELNSEKELFEQILIKTDDYNTFHFFSFLEKAKKKLWKIEPKTAATLDDFEFMLVKLGTKYRPFPQIDHKSLFTIQ